MELRNKKILIISPESWGRSYLSKHQYALELVRRNNEVWFLNAPFHQRNSEALEIERKYPSLKIVDEKHKRGITRLPAFIQRRIIRKYASRLQKVCNVSFDVVWSFDNSRYFFLDAFAPALRIHHVVDLHMNYQLEKACRTAQVCFAVTSQLVKRCENYQPNTYFIQHGFAPFEQTTITKQPGGAKIHAAYVGNLMMKSLDIKLLHTLALHHPDVCFHLVGNTGVNHLSVGVNEENLTILHALSNLHNVKVYGELKYEDAFTLASQCDILLSMYFNQEWSAGNSSKLLPYLHTGKVILSDYLPDYAPYNLLHMTKTREDYLTRFDWIKQNLDTLNHIDEMARRRHFAGENTYAAQINRIEHILGNTVKN